MLGMEANILGLGQSLHYRNLGKATASGMAAFQHYAVRTLRNPLFYQNLSKDLSVLKIQIKIVLAASFGSMQLFCQLG